VKKPNSVNNLRRSLGEYARERGLVNARVYAHATYNAILGVLKRARDEGVIPMFLLKGGVAIELRFGLRARASKDVDLGMLAPASELLPLMRAVCALTWDDFSFAIKRHDVTVNDTVRLFVQVYYFGKPFDTAKIDLTPANDEMVTEFLPSFSFGAIALPEPSDIPCLSVLDQVAQKIHAVTDPASKDRARDLVDIMLHEPLIAGRWAELGAVCVRVFTEREKHSWPPFREFPPEWIANANELLRAIDETRDAREAIRVLWSIVTFAKLGVVEDVNREYRFVLSEISSPSNIVESKKAPLMQSAIDDGFRLLNASVQHGITQRTGTYVFAVFEKNGNDRQAPRLHMRLKTVVNGTRSNLSGFLKNTSDAIANQVLVRVAGAEPTRHGSIAKGDEDLPFNASVLHADVERSYAGIMVEYRSDDGTRYQQLGTLRREQAGYVMDGLGAPLEVERLSVPYDGLSDT
jgi:hypothetical protein